MENAAKALRIAGSVLLAILILGALVLAYNKLSAVQQTKYASQKDQQAADFNSQFEAYNKTKVYGSELFSVVNLATDYNKSNAIEEGYETVGLKITINKAVGIFAKGQYTLQRFNEKYIEFNENISNTGKQKIGNTEIGIKTAAAWLRVSNQEITILKNERKLSTDDISKINNYKNLISQQSDMVNKTFKCTDVQYSSAGRVKSMTFVEE